MRRITRWLALAVPAAALLAPGAAPADYHPACLALQGQDHIIFAVEGRSIVFGGTVRCPGAQGIDSDLDMQGSTAGLAAASCAGVPDCLDPLTASEERGLVDGAYRVVMTFHVESVGGLVVFDPAPRCEAWFVAGGVASGPEECIPPPS